MPRRKSAEKELRWQEILKQQVDSGLSIRQFCLTRSVSLPSFYAWRRRLREPLDDDATTRKATVAPLDNRRLFVPLQVLDHTARLGIIHPSGCRMELTGEVDVVALRLVIETLDAAEHREGATR